MLDPLPQRISGRIPAQHQDIADATVGVRPAHRAQFVDAVSDGRQVRNRQEGGVLGQLASDPNRAVPRRTAGPVRHRHESRIHTLEGTDGPPQPRLRGLVAGRRELDGEGNPAGIGCADTVHDRRCPTLERVTLTRQLTRRRGGDLGVQSGEGRAALIGTHRDSWVFPVGPRGRPRLHSPTKPLNRAL